MDRRRAGEASAARLIGRKGNVRKHRSGDGKDNSGKLFDPIINEQGLKSDAALTRLIDLGAPVISKIRHGNQAIWSATILRVNEKLAMAVGRIRELIGVCA